MDPRHDETSSVRPLTILEIADMRRDTEELDRRIDAAIRSRRTIGVAGRRLLKEAASRIRRNQIVKWRQGDVGNGTTRMLYGRVMRRVDDAHVEVCFTHEFMIVADAELSPMIHTGRIERRDWRTDGAKPIFVPFPSMRRMKMRRRMTARYAGGAA